MCKLKIHHWPSIYAVMVCNYKKKNTSYNSIVEFI